ncbi:MAG: hypothetical protein M3020_27710 [Myxococcota bacterium]|jgi:hypothetical protein|nr:hypothetical protein [Myxococcota bacterium]
MALRRGVLVVSRGPADGSRSGPPRLYARRQRRTARDQRHTTDHDEIDVLIEQGLKDRAKVRLAYWIPYSLSRR